MKLADFLRALEMTEADGDLVALALHEENPAHPEAVRFFKLPAAERLRRLENARVRAELELKAIQRHIKKGTYPAEAVAVYLNELQASLRQVDDALRAARTELHWHN